MPPPQCPDCGRFLSHDFVEGLASEPAPCPRCGTVLHADQFELAGETKSAASAGPETRAPETPAPETSAVGAGEGRQDADEPPPAADVGGPVTVGPDGDSVRPPDLDPDSVRGPAPGNSHPRGDRDVLEGWDLPGIVAPVIEDTSSEDLVVAAGTILVAGVAGGLVGALLTARHRAFGAVVGTLIGASAAAAGSRVFSPVAR